MSEIFIETVKVTTAGGAGAATGSKTTIPVHGFLLDVYLDYHGSCPATADVTISDAVFGNIVVKTNNATDVWIAPRKQTCDVAAANTGSFDLVPVNGQLTVAVAQADALTDCLVATLRFMRP
jgi:hypothetical protein